MEREDQGMGCEDFQSRIPELWLDNSDLFDHPHVRRCALCRALIEDLETIAREAGRRERGEIQKQFQANFRMLDRLPSGAKARNVLHPLRHD
jgi:hypothetical protein